MTDLKRLEEGLTRLLEAWASGDLSAEEVFLESERLWETGDEWPTLDEDEAGSVVIEVLAGLSTLNFRQITVEDVPAMLRFLQAAEAGPAAGWSAYHRYWATVDFDRRAKELEKNPLYVVVP